MGSRSPREVPFVEISSLRDKGTLSDRIVEFPALVASGIAYKDAFFVVRLKRIVLILLNMDVGSAPPYSEVGDVWFALIEGLEGGRAREQSSRQPIPHMDHRGDAFTPERRRQSRLREHSSDSLTHSPVSSLS